MKLRTTLLTFFTGALLSFLSVAAEAKPPAQAKFEEIAHLQKTVIDSRKKTMIEQMDIALNFKSHKVYLTRRTSIFGLLDPGEDLRRISHSATITPKQEQQFVDALQRIHAFDLKSEPVPKPHSTMHWWCTALWSASEKLPPDPMQNDTTETFVYKEQGQPKHSIVFNCGVPTAERLALHEIFTTLLKQTGISIKANPDETVTEEGDQMPTIPTELKELFDHLENYKGKRVTVSGWPVSDGHVVLGLSLQKSAHPGDAKYLAIDRYVSSFASESQIKQDLKARLTVDGVLSGWCDSVHPVLVRITRIAPETSR